MGGECKNVGVYVPPHIEGSAFDRSNLYVAVSRPTHFLCVIGNPQDVDALVMRDPRPIQSGLLMRLRRASVLSDVPELRAQELEAIPALRVCNWKIALGDEDSDLDFIPEDFDIYDQSDREAFGVPTPACPVSYQVFRTREKALQKRMSPDAVTELCKRVFRALTERLYPTERRAVAEVIVVNDDDDEDEDEQMTPAEPAGKRLRAAEEEEEMIVYEEGRGE
jgi:hypothetical protein